MIVRLQELINAPGRRLCFDYSIDLSKEEVGWEFPFQEPVHVSGTVFDDAGVISLEASLQARVSTRCARCNAPVEYEKQVPVFFTLVKELANGEAQDDVVVVSSDAVELDDILVPELLLNMEMAVLCREDCKGLCPKCGKNLNDGPCGCDLHEPDPRLAKLAKLLEQTKEKS